MRDDPAGEQVVEHGEGDVLLYFGQAAQADR